MKQRKKKLDKGVEARRRARQSALKPATTRVIEDKRRRPAKHKSDLIRDAEEA